MSLNVLLYISKSFYVLFYLSTYLQTFDLSFFLIFQCTFYYFFSIFSFLCPSMPAIVLESPFEFYFKFASSIFRFFKDVYLKKIWFSSQYILKRFFCPYRTNLVELPYLSYICLNSLRSRRITFNGVCQNSCYLIAFDFCFEIETVFCC